MLALLAPFFLWSFLGGHKQVVLGINSDHIATGIALLGAVAIVLSARNYGRRELGIGSAIVVLVGLYLVSVFRSPDIFTALARMAEHLVYLVITYAAALLFKGRTHALLKLMLICALVSAVVIVIAAIFLGLGSWERVTIPVYVDGGFAYFPYGYESSSDPNVLSYYVYLGALVMLHRKNASLRWNLGFAVLCAGGILTLSRSGFLGFVVAVAAFANVIFSYRLLEGNARIKLQTLLFSACAIVAVLAISVIGLDDIGRVVYERINHQASNQDRIMRLIAVREMILTDVPGLLFGSGIGYSRATIDPHMFYLSTILDVGLATLVLNLGLILWPAFVVASHKHAPRDKALVVSIVVFFLVIALFYWHVRVYYFVLLVLFCFYFSLEPDNHEEDLDAASRLTGSER